MPVPTAGIPIGFSAMNLSTSNPVSTVVESGVPETPDVIPIGFSAMYLSTSNDGD